MTEPSCPHCGLRMVYHEPVEDAPEQPQPGHVSLCVNCARPSFFDYGPFGLILRLPTGEELRQLHATPEFHKQVEWIKANRHRSGGPQGDAD